MLHLTQVPFTVVRGGEEIALYIGGAVRDGEVLLGEVSGWTERLFLAPASGVALATEVAGRLTAAEERLAEEALIAAYESRVDDSFYVEPREDLWDNPTI